VTVTWAFMRMLSQLKVIYVEWKTTVMDRHETLLFVLVYHDHKKTQ
jgi:hypothetical protein